MEYKLRIVDVDTGATVGTVEGQNAYGAFEVGDDYVRQYPYKDYLVIDEATGARVTRNKVLDKNLEIRLFAESEVGGNF